MKRAILLIAFLFTWVLAVGAQSVPNPTVIGPIPVSAAPGDPSHNYPFLSADVDLESRGYVEEEFFFEGLASTYNMNPNLPSQSPAQITSSSRFYRTRMIVRRPISAESFNGTVILEWQNVTGGYEPDSIWNRSRDHLMRRGYAWVGVTVQRAGIPFLKAWSPTRYGTLSVMNTSSFMVDADGLSWDIFSQAAQAVRHPHGIDPVAGLPVLRVFAAGWSQSANRLADYYNQIQPLADEFDAFALIGLDGKVLRPLRTDAHVKVFKVLNETNVAGNSIAISQALLRDDDDNVPNLRRWEVAGASQLDYHDAEVGAPLLARDNVPPIATATCVKPALSRIPWHFVLNAAYDHLVEWVKHDLQPPSAPAIETSPTAEISLITRDSDGNALGGIRLSQHEVPTATNTGVNSPVDAGICKYVGSYEPFADLDARYADHETYLSQVIAETHKNQQHGFVVGADAAATIREAAKSDIGRQ